VTLLQDTVRQQAERQPEAIAVVSGQQRMLYRELEEASNRVARLLRLACGCQRGDRVALLLPKSLPALVGMLGVLKADCMYVPMDISSPAARLGKIIDICEPKVILADAANASLLSAIQDGCKTLISSRIGWLTPGAIPETNLESAFCWDDLPSVSAFVPDSSNKAEDTAHILFTSGSTGIPKGVVITHSSVIHFLKWATKYFEMAPSDHISCHPPLHFDLSTFDVYGTFFVGAQLHLVPTHISFLPHKLADFIRRSGLTQWFSVPSALKYMVQFDVVRFNDFPALKRLLWCGEALPTPTLIHLMRRLPQVKFTNLYGPTESTIASSYYTVPCCPDDERSAIPIGRACEGEDLILLDGSLQNVQVGEVGDLYIKGVGLSPGYWREPEKTESVFIQHSKHGRIYKTGDLARIGNDKLIYLLGRSDSQIKSRGYRIELGEIETALNALGILRECAVIATPMDGFEGTTICCAYVPAKGIDICHSDLRQQLTRVLPPYMIPSQWMALDSFPLNVNGKCDRSRLRAQFLTGSRKARSLVASDNRVN